MFGELPGLLGRNFAIGFYLPTAVFLGGVYWLELQYDYLPESLEQALLAERSWLGAGILLAITWLLALFLMGINRPIVRLREGYGPLNRDWNPLKMIERRQLGALDSKLKRLRARRKTLRKGSPEWKQLNAELTPLAALRRRRFPVNPDHVLPTAFGNTMRAFETYSHAMYGVEATEVWNRLLIVMSGEARALVDEARAKVNFATNLWFVSCLLLLGYFGLAFWARTTEDAAVMSLNGTLFVLVFLALAGFASFSSRQLAVLLGLQVKASFDVFLPDLAKKMQFAQTDDRATQKKAWAGASAAMLLHSPQYLPQPEQSDHEEAKQDKEPQWVSLVASIIRAVLRDEQR